MEQALHRVRLGQVALQLGDCALLGAGRGERQHRAQAGQHLGAGVAGGRGLDAGAAPTLAQPKLEEEQLLEDQPSLRRRQALVEQLQLGRRELGRRQVQGAQGVGQRGQAQLVQQGLGDAVGDLIGVVLAQRLTQALDGARRHALDLGVAHPDAAELRGLLVLGC